MVCLELLAIALRRQHSWPVTQCLQPSNRCQCRRRRSSFSGSVGRRSTIAMARMPEYRLGLRHLARKALSSRCLRGRVIGGKVDARVRSTAADCPLPGCGAVRSGLWPCQWIRLPMTNARSIEPPEDRRSTPDSHARPIVRWPRSHAKPHAISRWPCRLTMGFCDSATTVAAARMVPR